MIEPRITRVPAASILAVSVRPSSMAVPRNGALLPETEMGYAFNERSLTRSASTPFPNCRKPVAGFGRWEAAGGIPR